CRARSLEAARQLARAGARLRLAVRRGSNGVERIVRVIVRSRAHELDVPACAPMVDQAMVRNPIQPRRELGAWRIGRARTDHAHPYVLEELVYDTGVTALAQQVAIYGALVARIQRVESGGIVRGIREHQVL